MKGKWLWVFLLLIVGLALLTLVRTFRLTGHKEVSARLASVTTDDSGQRHIIYEITNRTSRTTELAVFDLETKYRRMGWWPLGGSSTKWNVETSAGAVKDLTTARLNAFKGGDFEISLDRFADAGSALRARILALMVENRLELRLRSIGNWLHVPRKWLAPSYRYWVDLPEAQLPPSVRLAPIPAPVPIHSSDLVVPKPPSKTDEVIRAGVISLTNAKLDLRQALNIYADLADSELEIAPQVRELPAIITLQTGGTIQRSEAIQLFEEALRQQAGLTIEHLDRSRISISLPRPQSR